MPRVRELELARELGAEFTVNAAEEDPAVAIQKLGGADQAIALAVSPSRSSTRTDLREVFELHAPGKTEVTREIRPLENVNDAIADVEAGRVAARVVFEP
jgi:alcohol dehydrogenase, propanol-preferring